MKIPLLLLAASAGALAQPLPSRPDLAALPRVDSPNHAASAQLAAPAPRLGGRVPGSALQLVDANGKAVARYNGSGAVLAYGNDQITLQLMGDWNSQQGKPNSGGLTWMRFGLFHVSADCSGTPYFWTASYGTRFNGVTVNDGGKFYAYIGEPAAAQTVDIQSYYDFETAACYPYAAPSQPFMAVTTVVPLDALGRPPFFLK